MKAIALFLCLAAAAASTFAAPPPPPPPWAECSNVCSTTSSCSKTCYADGDASTCGNFGRCKSCASYCTSGVRCSEPACMQDGLLTSCQATGRECQACSAAICDGTPLRCGDGQRCSVPVHGGYLYPTCETWASNTIDRDLDQVPDALELALARRFFPSLNMRFPRPPAGCVGPYPYAEACDYFNKDSYGQFYSTTLSNEFGGGATRLPFAVRPYRDATPQCDEAFECLEVAYTLLYNYDYGDEDEEHRGDSENVAVLLSRNVSNLRRGYTLSHPWSQAQSNVDHWAFVKVFAAAHTCAGGPPTFYDDLDGRIYTRVPNFPGSGSTTLVSDYEPLGVTPFGGLALWVAEFTNATYFTQHLCNVGNTSADDCTTDRGSLNLDQYNVARDDLLNAGESRCHANFPPTVQGPNLDPPLHGANGFPLPAQYAIWGGAPFGEASPLVHKLKEGTFKWDQYDVVCY